ncbi:MAG: tetratricopeptide repeat protein [Acidobacteria bacterium]|nr:tetratricopeptide repeat protein [Acidobacteriota bacterium]
MTLPDEKLTAYLLGELPETEQVELEQQYLKDDELFEQVEVLEDELIVAYLLHQLPTDQTQQFESVFLRAPERQEKYKNLKAILEFVNHSESVPAFNTSVLGEREGWWEKIKDFFRPAFSPGGLILAGLTAMFVLATTLSIIAFRSHQSPEGPPTTADNTPPPVPTPVATNPNPELLQQIETLQTDRERERTQRQQAEKQIAELTTTIERLKVAGKKPVVVKPEEDQTRAADSANSNQAVTTIPASPPLPPLDDDLLWQFISNSQKPEDFFGYLKLYPEGKHAEEARTALADLRPQLLSEAHNTLGISHFRLGEYDQALIEFQKAIELRPQFPEAQFNLGLVLIKLGRLDEAQKLVQAIKPAKPSLARQLEAELRKARKTN